MDIEIFFMIKIINQEFLNHLLVSNYFEGKYNYGFKVLYFCDFYFY